MLDAGDSTVHLPEIIIEMRKESVECGYVALSHCWGKFSNIRQVGENYADHSKNVNLAALSTQFSNIPKGYLFDYSHYKQRRYEQYHTFSVACLGNFIS